MKFAAKIPQLLACVLLVAVLAACVGAPAEQTHRRTFIAFGTLVEVTIYGESKQLAERAMDRVEEEFNYMHTTWHPWQRSALSRVNMLLETTEWFSVAPSVRPLIVRSRELARASGYRAMQFNFVVETNTRAIAIWQRAGFGVVGRLPGAFHHPTEGYVDALVMYRSLV